MANSQEGRDPRRLDLLAAVVLHTLVAEGRESMTCARIATACERDPDDQADMGEIEAALELLCDDGLAERSHVPKDEDRDESDNDNWLFRPTRAAVRASELSF